MATITKNRKSTSKLGYMVNNFVSCRPQMARHLTYYCQAKRKGIADQELESMSWEEKTSLLRSDPVSIFSNILDLQFLSFLLGNNM
jgi:hypothetical protein